jgi:hypothetical protein
MLKSDLVLDGQGLGFFQEFVVSSECHFYYHDLFLSWPELRPFLQYWSDAVERPRSLDIPSVDKYEDKQRVRKFIRAKQAWTKDMQLATLLEDCHTFNATDPRDLAYAFLGLASDTVRSQFQIDYSSSTTMKSEEF